MKLYTQHRCARRHRSTDAFIRCAIPRHAWVSGHGNVALIAWCDVPSISLWPDADSAEHALADLRCGHACTGNHELVEIRLT